MKLLTGLFILFSIPVFAQVNAVKYVDGTTILNGIKYIPTKKSTKNPGILVLPAWMGIDAHAKNTAAKLANLGYIAFVADIYGEGNYPTDVKKAGEQSGYYKKNTAAYRKRIELALEQLIKAGANANEIVIIGYCFGGTGAIESARANLPVKGIVSFHGGLAPNPESILGNIKPTMLICHGADDPFESVQEVNNFQKELQKAGQIIK